MAESHPHSMEKNRRIPLPRSTEHGIKIAGYQVLTKHKTIRYAK
jgi:hypothetical protein